MRKFLLFIGYSSAVGGLLDGLIAIYAAIIILSITDYTWALNSEVLFREHISWLYWIKQAASYVMNRDFVDWIFALPALAFFTTRVITSGLVGQWALNRARSMEST